MIDQFLRFLRREDGVVTIEWVALAAGVAILAFGVIAVLDQPLQDTSVAIADGVSSAANSLIGQY